MGHEVSSHPIMLTHWGRDKMDAISQTTFSNAFSWTKMYEFRLRFHWNLVLRFELTIFKHWIRKWLGTNQATSHYLNWWWLVYWRIYESLCLNELKHEGWLKHHEPVHRYLPRITAVTNVWPTWDEEDPGGPCVHPHEPWYLGIHQ